MKKRYKPRRKKIYKRPLGKRLRQTKRYEEWRSAVIRRDKKCVLCGTTTRLRAHHIVPLWYILKRYDITSREDAFRCKILWDVNNGATLCEDFCHPYIHTFDKEVDYE